MPSSKLEFESMHTLHTPQAWILYTFGVLQQINIGDYIGMKFYN